MEKQPSEQPLPDAPEPLPGGPAGGPPEAPRDPAAPSKRWPRVVWARWVLSNLLSTVIGFLAASLITAFVADSLTLGIGVIIGAVIGVVVGLAQWQVLRDYMKGLRPGIWIWATAAGFALTLFVMGMLGQAMAYTANLEVQGDAVRGWADLAQQRGTLLATLALAVSFWTAHIGAAVIGALSGLVMGGVQALVLRVFTRKAIWWILVTMLGAAAGMLLSLAISMLIVQTAPDTPVWWSIINYLVGPTGVFFFCSLATGLVLTWMVRDAQPSQGVAPSFRVR